MTARIKRSGIAYRTEASAISCAYASCSRGDGRGASRGTARARATGLYERAERVHFTQPVLVGPVRRTCRVPVPTGRVRTSASRALVLTGRAPTSASTAVAAARETATLKTTSPRRRQVLMPTFRGKSDTDPEL
jgi:hypothetical protein